MDAIILAGGVNLPGDPLYTLTGVEKKALIPLAGRPMVAWISQALLDSGLIERIVVVGLTPEEINFSDLPVYLVRPAGELMDNALAGLAKLRELNPGVKKFLLCTSDIPLIRPEIIQGFISECGDLEAEGYYAVVEEKVMEARFPQSRRTFVPFKDGRYSGGDIFLFDVSAVQGNIELARSLTGSRKNYWQQARMLGLGFIIRFLLGLMTVDEAAERGRKILNINARIVKTRFAELGMDLDKPRQYEMIKTCLEQQVAQPLVNPTGAPQGG